MRLWEQYSLKYDDIWDSPMTKIIAHEVVSTLHKMRCASVIELGCGTGLMTRELLNSGFTVLGVDKCYSALQIARKRCPEAKFVQTDIEDIASWDCGCFTGVVACNVLQICEHPEEVMRAISVLISTYCSPALFTWPTSTATLCSLLQHDLKDGRNPIASLGAFWQRVIFGVLAIRLSITPNSDHRLMKILTQNMSPFWLTTYSILDGLQRFVVVLPEGDQYVHTDGKATIDAGEISVSICER